MSGIDRDWMKDAKCKGDDPTKWHSDNRGGGQEKKARELCRGCPVIRECAAYHIQFETSGVVVAGIPVPDAASPRHHTIAMEKLRRIADNGKP